MIRLNAIPITGLPQMSKADVPESYTVRVNCVLYSGQLAEYQELEVQVNRVPLKGRREGNQSVFTWQFFQASDEVQIALLSRGRRIKHWQGCWNERDAILHAGTLPVQIFFEGKLQTMATVSSAALARRSSSLAETVIGSRPIETGDLERNQDEKRTGGSRGEGETVIVQDLLVIVASEQPPAVQQEREVEENEREDEGAVDSEEREGDNAGQWEDGPYEVEDEEEQWEEERSLDKDGREGDNASQEEKEEGTPDRQEVEGSDTVRQVDDVAVKEAVAPHTEVHDLVGRDEQQPGRNHLAGRHIAAFHASPLALEKTLESLKELVARMPSKTLIVDVRPMDRQKKKYQEQGFSKQLLRSVFGAKYWDRGWAIQTVSQMVPPADKAGFSTWRYVVDKLENPHGIPSLVKKLEEGYSIVVMDSIAAYAESRRRAVIDELQRRVPALNVGPLG